MPNCLRRNPIYNS